MDEEIMPHDFFLLAMDSLLKTLKCSLEGWEEEESASEMSGMCEFFLEQIINNIL